MDQLRLTEKQSGVLCKMLLGLTGSLIALLFSAFFYPFSFHALTQIECITIAINSLVLPTLCLTVAIARLARHRFFTPEDIDGGALSTNTKQANVLQSLLQNTLEQQMLVVVTYLAWSVIMPSIYIGVIPCASIIFSVGRILFFIGYKDGAPSRALGFSLTFYPTILMLICLFFRLFWTLCTPLLS